VCRAQLCHSGSALVRSCPADGLSAVARRKTRLRTTSRARLTRCVQRASGCSLLKPDSLVVVAPASAHTLPLPSTGDTVPPHPEQGQTPNIVHLLQRPSPFGPDYRHSTRRHHIWDSLARTPARYGVTYRSHPVARRVVHQRQQPRTRSRAQAELGRGAGIARFGTGRGGVATGRAGQGSRAEVGGSGQGGQWTLAACFIDDSGCGQVVEGTISSRTALHWAHGTLGKD